MTNVFCKTEKERLALTAEDICLSLFSLNITSVSIENTSVCSIYAYLQTVTEIHICLCCRNYLRKIRHLESDGRIPHSFTSTPTTWSGTSAEMDRTNLPTTPKDILSFAWQISKGMAYLSDIKVRKRPF